MTHDSQPNAVSGPTMPSSQPILLRALRWGLLLTVLLVAIFGVIGWFVAAQPGLFGGALGAAFSGLFFAMTVGSIAFANRFIESPAYIGLFFGIVMGAWLLKFILFIVAALLLRDQSWLHPTMFFIAVVSGVIVSLGLDVVIVTKSRLPIVSDPH